MIPDSNIQVWLDTQAALGQTTLVTYVKSMRDMQIGFRMDVIQRGGAGTSRITQKGTINANAATPTSLGRVALGIQKGSDCSIELALDESGREIGVYRFDCAR